MTETYEISRRAYRARQRKAMQKEALEVLPCKGGRLALLRFAKCTKVHKGVMHKGVRLALLRFAEPVRFSVCMRS